MADKDLSIRKEAAFSLSVGFVDAFLSLIVDVYRQMDEPERYNPISQIRLTATRRAVQNLEIALTANPDKFPIYCLKAIAAMDEIEESWFWNEDVGSFDGGASVGRHESNLVDTSTLRQLAIGEVNSRN